jgi:hypothetical protein
VQCLCSAVIHYPWFKEIDAPLCTAKPVYYKSESGASESDDKQNCHFA